MTIPNLRTLAVVVAILLCGPTLLFAEGVVKVKVNGGGDIWVTGDDTGNHIYMVTGAENVQLIRGRTREEAAEWIDGTSIEFDGTTYPPGQWVVLTGTSRNSRIDVDMRDTAAGYAWPGDWFSSRMVAGDNRTLKCKRLKISDGAGDGWIDLNAEVTETIVILGGSGAEIVQVEETQAISCRIDLGPNPERHRDDYDAAWIRDSIFLESMTVKQTTGTAIVFLDRSFVGGWANFSLFAGDDKLRVSNSYCQSLLANMGSEDDGVSILSSSFDGVSVSTAGGDDVIDLEDTLVEEITKLSCGKGNDDLSIVLTDFQGNATVKCDSGNDALRLVRSDFQKKATLTCGSGSDFVDVKDTTFQGNTSLNCGWDNDIVVLDLASTSPLGEPTLGSTHGHFRLYGGGGDDWVTSRGSSLDLSSLSIILGGGDDLLNVDWDQVTAKSIRFSGNAGRDSLDTHDTVFNPRPILSGFNPFTPFPSSGDFSSQLDSFLDESLLNPLLLDELVLNPFLFDQALSQ